MRPELHNEFSGTAESVVQAQQIRDVHIARYGPDKLPVPSQLPSGISRFTDRDEVLGQLSQAVLADASTRDRPAVVILTGLGGVGKSSVAVRWGTRNRERFPDGQLYVNLHGYDSSPLTPVEVLDGFLRALDVASSRLPAGAEGLAALYRTMLADRRVLVILDNASTADQVQPLLPSSSESAAIVTTRSSLSGLVRREGAIRLTVRRFGVPESLSLISAVVGNNRVEQDPDGAALIAERCGYLPLALRIAAERSAVSYGTMRELADELSIEQLGLEAFRADDELESEVRVVFSSSYAGLPAEQARIFRYASLAPGSTFSTASVSVLTTTPLPATRRALDSLVAFSMLERVAHDRYQFHDLVRVFAQEQSAAEDDAASTAAALDRFTAWMANTVNAADRIFAPQRRPVPLDPPDEWTRPLDFASYDSALAWCDAERVALLDTITLSADTGRHAAAWRIALGAVTFYKLRNHRADWLTASEIAVRAARTAGDRYAEAWSLISLGGALTLLGRTAEARPHYEEALILCREIGDRMGEGMTLGNLGELARMLGEYEEAVDYGEQAIAIWREIGERRLEAIVLIDSVAGAQLEMGHFDEARRLFDRARERSDGGDLHVHGLAVYGYAQALEGAGDPDAARRAFDEAAGIQRRSGDLAGLADTLLTLARIAPDPDAARAALTEALPVLTTLEDPRLLDVSAALENFF